MTNSTITGFKTTEVTLGTGNYGLTLTIAATGAVAAPNAVLLNSGGTLINYGGITGKTSFGVDITAGGTVLNRNILAGLRYGVETSGTALIRNGGTISSTYEGVLLGAGGTLINSGYVFGTGRGVVAMSASTLVNSGSIYGTSLAGVGVMAGAQVTNAGSIGGGAVGVYLAPAASLTNAGTIRAGTNAVDAGYGAVVNTGYIYGFNDGIYVAANATVTNAGTIGGEVNAFYSGFGASPTLIVDTGAVFHGDVVVESGRGELVFAGAGGTFNMNSQFSGFDAIDFAATASWSVEGSTVELAGPIIGNFFVPGDQLVIDGFKDATETYSASAGLGTLTLQAPAGGKQTLYFETSLSLTTANFAHSVNNITGKTTISYVPCFAAGTLLLTPGGEVPVECLRPGDWLITRHDPAVPRRQVIWTGQRTVDFTRPDTPQHDRPIRIAAGAVARGVPDRDLYLSPNHAIFLAPHLFEAASLLNGSSIAPDVTRRHVTYHHVELSAHDIVLAHGLPVESFLDTGNRHMFAGEGESPHPGRPPCAELLQAGPHLAAARAALRQRAMASV